MSFTVRSTYGSAELSVADDPLTGYAGDGVYSYTNDEVLSTALRIAASFINVYPIANATQKDSSGQVLGIPIGRYVRPWSTSQKPLWTYR